ncbi:hypothetical protein HRR83_003198 [Exophiala dermatitidis]|uniref:Uncharacterized protein n=1 Tax=Exophiala dermatitidis TaxID=5970 RepID=A0AAN6IVA8_EXODE|nr:hypothetical protein HRR74_004646 [Exophiala dermatitidis]KAJ4521249.1 hypothetical protein HRR73_003590 [Exophiala dermatitidis]KAJ4547841.1 hypothetical protein HRR76_000464 [Exophiala dermatitidis]KAJ4553779.1 hypothetical protein HRR77_002153 [Exophiala dermatitidis]KAJ4578107.1 hypothetical protein HRR79_001425 [Exophiala dermatitidis]
MYSTMGRRYEQIKTFGSWELEERVAWDGVFPVHCSIFLDCGSEHVGNTKTDGEGAKSLVLILETRGGQGCILNVFMILFVLVGVDCWKAMRLFTLESRPEGFVHVSFSFGTHTTSKT